MNLEQLSSGKTSWIFCSDYLLWTPYSMCISIGTHTGNLMSNQDKTFYWNLERLYLSHSVCNEWLPDYLKDCQMQNPFYNCLLLLLPQTNKHTCMHGHVDTLYYSSMYITIIITHTQSLYNHLSGNQNYELPRTQIIKSFKEYINASVLHLPGTYKTHSSAVTWTLAHYR